MKHLRAERLAELTAGRLTTRAHEEATAHLQGCQGCRASLARIEAGRLAMAEIKELKSPDLGWDSIGARIYWTTSSEQRAKGRDPSLRWRRARLGAAVVVAVAAVSLWTIHEQDKIAEAPVESPELQAPVAPLVTELVQPAVVLSGLVTFAQGDVRVGGQPLDFDQEIAVGAQLSVGEGGLVVQFGEHSAFRLASQSELRVQRFDSQRVELAVVGAVNVDITRRLPGQEFVVVAGEHEVVVRGTAFRVEYSDGSLGVSCTRGKVVVTRDDDMVPVPAGQAFGVLSEGWDAASLQASPMDPAELRALDLAMYMPMLPAWSDRRGLAGTTTVLEVSAGATQRVAIDGVNVAEGSFFLRAMSGRHQVALMDAKGALVDELWVDGAAGRRQSMNVAKPVAAVKTTLNLRKARSLRRQQMHAALKKGQRTSRCLAPLVKQGLSDGSFVVFDLGVNTDGSQDYLNVVESNLGSATVACLRHAVDAESLPRGPAAGFRLRLSF